jgi:GT2 family glycosyltransferase
MTGPKMEKYKVNDSKLYPLRHSIVICTLDRPDSVLRLLKSINETKIGRRAQIIIVDSSRNLHFQERLRLQLAKNFNQKSKVFSFFGGLPSSRNFGIKHIEVSSKGLVHFFDDDIVIEKSYFDGMENFFKENPEAYGGAPRIAGLYSDLGTPTKSNYFLKNFPSVGFGQVTVSGCNFWIEDVENQLSINVDWLPGCCMVYRKTVLDIFRFNENLEKGPGRNYALGEDVDFGLKISGQFTLKSIPNVRIKHLLEKSKRDKRILMYRANATWLGYLSKVARRKVAKRFVFLIQLNKIFAVPINDCRALFDYSTKVLKHFNLYLFI